MTVADPHRRNRLETRSGWHPLLFVFCAFVLVFAGSGCATGYKKENTVVGEQGSAEGQWRSKALVRNLQTGKSGTLNLEIVAHEPSQMRMEVTGALAAYVASFALNGNQVQYILAQQKKFVTAPTSPYALRDLVPISISPRDLVRLLFDRPMPESEWKCETGPGNLPLSCEHRVEPVRFHWEERGENTRRLKIESTSAEMTMVIDEAKSKVELKPGTFELTPPAGYKQETKK